MTTNFDTLAAQAHDARNKTGERAFVEAALALPCWHCVGVAPEGATDEPEPLVAPIDREPHLLVFTDGARAAAFAERRAATRGGDAITLELDTSDAVAYLADLASIGVTGVHFNDGDHAVSVPLRRVLELGRRP